MINSCLLFRGDARRIPLADRSVNCVVTSPPYWGLRDYGTARWEGGDPACEHGVDGWHGAKQTGQAQNGHASAADRLGRTECRRCGARRVDRQIGLEPTPAEFVETMVAVFRQVRRVLRDDGTLWLNLGDSYNAYNGNRGRSTSFSAATEDQLPDLPSGHGLTAKDLKPKDLVGIPWRVALALQADGWFLRSDIIWHKPNPMPESVTDRPTKAHEYLFLLAKNERYFYDGDAIREEGTRYAWNAQQFKGGDITRHHGNANGGGGSPEDPNAGRNKRSVWTVATQPYSGAHFATFPPKLIEPCILAGCPAGGIVLDPFNGAGTTGTVAVAHGRRYVGLDLSSEYLAMARQRIERPHFVMPKPSRHEFHPLFSGD